MLILGLILVLLAGTTSTSRCQRSLLDEVDRNLLGAQRAGDPVPVSAPHGARAIPTGARDLAAGRAAPSEGYRGGVFYIALAPDGSVLANPQQVDVSAT